MRNAAEEVETRLGWAWLGTPLIVLELAGACTLSWIVLARLITGACTSGIDCFALYLVFVLPGSVLVGIALLLAHNWLVRDMRTRLKVDVVLTLSAMVWLLAGQRALEQQTRLEEQQSQVMQTMDRAGADSEDRCGRDQFLAARRESGAHGPPGHVPAVFAVQDDGLEVRVELLDTLRPDLPLALARVRPDPARSGGWSGCPMRADAEQTKYGAYRLRPGAPLSFTLEPRCAEAFRAAPLEFRVGSWKAPGGTPGWWSDSALAVPDGWGPVDGPAAAPRPPSRTTSPASDEPLAAVPIEPRREREP